MALAEVSGKVGQYEETGVAVADAVATIWTIDCNRMSRTCRVTVKNSHATVAFAEFNTAIRTSTSAAFITHADTAAEFTTGITEPMVDSSASPVTLAAGASVSFKYEIGDVDALRIQIGGNGAASTADLYVAFGE